jgi:cytochrome c-type biogenesis protein CcmH/NrfG
MFRKRKIPSASMLVFVVFLTGSGCVRTPQQKEAKFMERGKSYIAQKDFARAIIEFKNAVSVMPQDSEAHYQLAAAKLRTGDVVGAVNELKKSTELNPRHADAQVMLAEIMALSGVKAVAEDGVKRMNDLLRSSPDNVDALDTLAINELQLGKEQDAEPILSRLSRRFPRA